MMKKLGVVHNRAVLRDPKDSMKLLPWTHKIIANAKAVFASPHRGVSKNISKATFQKYVIVSIGGFGEGKYFIAYCLLVLQQAL